MLNAIIVDNKIGNINLLKNEIREYCPQLSVVATAIDMQQALMNILKWRPDILFLDVELGEENGFDLIRKTRDFFGEAILVTACDHHAVKAFKEQVIDYLVRPIEIDALINAVKKAEKQIRLKQVNDTVLHMMQYKAALSYKIPLPSLEGYTFIDREEITRCDASGSYTNFVLKDGRRLLASINLKECEVLLQHEYFFRIHAAHIVNLTCISKYIKGRGGYIVMNDGATINVAINRKAAFLKSIQGKN